MKFKKSFGVLLFLIFLAIISVVGCSQNVIVTVSGEPEAQIPLGVEPVKRMLISHYPHEFARLSKDEATQILVHSTAFARNDDGQGDVECDVKLELQSEDPATKVNIENPKPFINPSTPFSIDNSQSFEAVHRYEWGNAKVVGEINWCGRFRPEGFHGCSLIGHNLMAVVRLPGDLRRADNEGILWLHEIGHGKGLPDRYDNAKAVMYGVLLTTESKHLNGNECFAYRSR